MEGREGAARTLLWLSGGPAYWLVVEEAERDKGPTGPTRLSLMTTSSFGYRALCRATGPCHWGRGHSGWAEGADCPPGAGPQHHPVHPAAWRRGKPTPLLISWARETAVFSHTLEERMNTKLWYLAVCQNNSKPHTCRLLASGDGKMTKVVFLAFSSWQAHNWLVSLLQFTEA